MLWFSFAVAGLSMWGSIIFQNPLLYAAFGIAIMLMIGFAIIISKYDHHE